MKASRERGQRRERGRVALFLAALSLAGVGRVLFGTSFRVASARRDDAFQELIHALPADRDLGYVSDIAPADVGGGDLYLTAQHAVAPRVLSTLPEGRWVVAHLSDPSRLAELCGRHGLRPVGTWRQGTLALLERRGP